MVPGQTEHKLSGDQKFKLIALLIERGFHFFKAAIIVICIVSSFAFAYMSVDAASGKKTDANLSVDFGGEANVFIHLFSKIGTERIVYWVLIISVLFYAWLQQRLRYKKTAYLQERIKQLELTMDPKRTSSSLTETGQTPKGASNERR